MTQTQTELLVSNLQSLLNYSFKNQKLLELACIHKSFGNERRASKNLNERDNERFEFLGDAVLDLVISEYLLETYQDESEGTLSKLRASLVNEKTLSKIALDLNLGPFLKLGKGEDQTGGREKESILASFFEALIAAIYLDGGIEVSRKFIHFVFKNFIEQGLNSNENMTDYKTILQELSQAMFKTAPKYEVLNTTGPDHDKIFEIKLTILGEEYATASGKNKKQAEQNAASIALKKLQEQSLK